MSINVHNNQSYTEAKSKVYDSSTGSWEEVPLKVYVNGSWKNVHFPRHFIDDFESGNLDKWNTVNNASVTTDSHTGSYAVKVGYGGEIKTDDTATNMPSYGDRVECRYYATDGDATGRFRHNNFQIGLRPGDDTVSFDPDDVNDRTDYYPQINNNQWYTLQYEVFDNGYKVNIKFLTGDKSSTLIDETENLNSQLKYGSSIELDIPSSAVIFDHLNFW